MHPAVMQCRYRLGERVAIWRTGCHYLMSTTSFGWIVTGARVRIKALARSVTSTHRLLNTRGTREEYAATRSVSRAHTVSIDLIFETRSTRRPAFTPSATLPHNEVAESRHSGIIIL